MIGKYALEIGAEEWNQGMVDGDYETKAMLGADCSGWTPFLRKGSLSPLNDFAQATASGSGYFIASSEDSNYLGENRIFVSNTGKYYSIDSAMTLTNRANGAKTYVRGKTDMVSFGGYTYTSSTDNVARLDGAWTFSESWWTGAGGTISNSNAPHPLAVFEGALWIADGKYLHKYDGTTVTNNVLTLTGDEIIMTMHVDPATGTLLLSVSSTINMSLTLPTKNFVYMYDGFSAKPRRKIPVDEIITGFYSLGNLTYCAYGLNLGVWTGSGVQFIRTFKGITYDNTKLISKHSLSNFRHVLLSHESSVSTLHRVLGYGEVISGRQKSIFTLKNTNSTSSPCLIANVGSDKILISNLDGTHHYLDLSTESTTGSMEFYTRRILMPRPILVHDVVVYMNHNNTSTESFYFIGDDGIAVTPTQGLIKNYVNSTTKYSKRFSINKKVDWFQLLINGTTSGNRLNKIVVYYSPAE